jgi:NAD+ diphosphatase
VNEFSSIQHYVKMYSTQSTEFEELLNKIPGRRVLLIDQNYIWLRDRVHMPTVAELRNINFDFLRDRQSAIHIGDFIFITTQAHDIQGLLKANLRYALDAADVTIQSQLVRGSQLIKWSEANYFCAKCAGTLRIHNFELAKECENCSHVYYPHIQPVAIVLISRMHKGKKELLLARGLPPREHYSCIAGFVEAGEPLEDCLRREVMEEVGVFVKNVKYFGSQTWPFPSQLMIGFTAEWESGEIHVDQTEISDAKWFSIDQLPLIPPRLSIARKMIDAAIQD